MPASAADLEALKAKLADAVKKPLTYAQLVPLQASLDAAEPGAFTINAQGAIFASRSFDLVAVNRPSYSYVVNISDTMGSVAMPVTIRVMPVNRPPVVLDQAFSVRELSPTNVSAGGQIVFTHPQKLAVTWTAHGPDAVDVTPGGVVFVVAGFALDFYATQSYTLSVTATDSNGLTASAIVILSVVSGGDARTRCEGDVAVVRVVTTPRAHITALPSSRPRPCSSPTFPRSSRTTLRPGSQGRAARATALRPPRPSRPHPTCPRPSSTCRSPSTRRRARSSARR